MGLRVSGRTDAQILLAAQERALDILAHAREEAERRTGGGLKAAAILLLQQQQRAEELLTFQQHDAARLAQRIRQGAAEMSDEKRQALLAEASREAEDLLDRQCLAAEVLRAGEKQLAVETHDAVEQTGLEILLTAHREAAAVLLEARMNVEQRRQRASDSGRPS